MLLLHSCLYPSSAPQDTVLYLCVSGRSWCCGCPREDRRCGTCRPSREAWSRWPERAARLSGESWEVGLGYIPKDHCGVTPPDLCAPLESVGSARSSWSHRPGWAPWSSGKWSEGCSRMCPGWGRNLLPPVPVSPQGPPGLPGLRGDAGPKGEKVSVRDMASG